MADVAICGAVDFPLVEPIVAGFATMNGAYRPREGQPEPAPQKASLSFLSRSPGLCCSEGAACIIIATKGFAKAHGFPYHTEMAGLGMTGGCHHFVAPNLETVRRCITESMIMRVFSRRTSMLLMPMARQPASVTKLKRTPEGCLCRTSVPPVSANKSQIGHAMGASKRC